MTSSPPWPPWTNPRKTTSCAPTPWPTAPGRDLAGRPGRPAPGQPAHLFGPARHLPAGSTWPSTPRPGRPRAICRNLPPLERLRLRSGRLRPDGRQGLADTLRTVEITANKVVSDEHDTARLLLLFRRARRHDRRRPTSLGQGGQDLLRRHPRARTRRGARPGRRVRRVVRTKPPSGLDRRHEAPRLQGRRRHLQGVGRVYGWEASTGEVDDWIFDDITRTFVMDQENREFLKKTIPGPWRKSDAGSWRRPIAACGRPIPRCWPPSRARLEIEGWIEDRMARCPASSRAGGGYPHGR